MDVEEQFSFTSTMQEIFKLLVVAGFAAWISNVLANRSHVKKIWWERRADAYTRLIEALSNLIFHAEMYSLDEYGQSKLTPEASAELTELFNKSRSEVRRASHAGEFLFSEKVIKSVEEYHLATGDEPSDLPGDLIDRMKIASEKCLKEVVDNSVVDLKLRGWFRNLFPLG